jgi:hypothetical protein
MPRIDPIHGVPVLTQAEFWASEAEREGQGRTGGDLQADFYAVMAADEARARAEWLKHENLLPWLHGLWERAHECWAEDKDCDEPPEPLAVIDVASDKYRYGMRSSTEEAEVYVRARTAAGEREVLVVAGAYTSHGSFYEPPDYDERYEWREVRHGFRVTWDNGHACGSLAGFYTDEAEAEAAGEAWLADWRAEDDEADEHYSYEVVPAIDAVDANTKKA